VRRVGEPILSRPVRGDALLLSRDAAEDRNPTGNRVLDILAVTHQAKPPARPKRRVKKLAIGSVEPAFLVLASAYAPQGR
jgi:hypothetical protein